MGESRRRILPHGASPEEKYAAEDRPLFATGYGCRLTKMPGADIIRTDHWIGKGAAHRMNRRWIGFVMLLLFLLPMEALAENKQLVVTFVGDCTLGSEDRLRDTDTAFDSYLKNNGYTYFFEKVQSVIAHDDLTVANLEGVFSNSASGKVKKTYNFRGPVSFVNVLTQSSIECVNIANNHSLDYGANGMKDTVNTLTKAGVHWFGTNDVYHRTCVFHKNGVKIGFLGVEIRYWGANQDLIKDQVQALKKAGCQVIVGTFHGGTEYATLRDQSQEKIARRLIQYGCNIVIGHHPHVLQGIDVTDGVTICYSLGNFVFGGNARIKQQRALYTALFQFTFTFDENNNYLGHQLNIIPAHVSGDTEMNTYQPRLVTGGAANTVLKQIQRDTPFSLKPYVKGVGAVQDFVAAPKQ
ncbi:MAG: CapA family protein [Clostridia bacterium]|nr:CapA family protein [Clostridia bacterium]